MTNQCHCGIILVVRLLGVAQLVARYLGVVEAASSSLVTQTRKREMSNLPFFSVFMGLFRSLKSQNQELSVYLKHAVIVPENRVGTKSGT